MPVKNKIFIPTLISSANFQPVRTLPHIYFYNGLKDCEDYFIQHYPLNSTASVSTTLQTQFPYVDYYDGLTPSSESNSLLFFNEPAVYGVAPTSSLYTEYWDTYVELLYNPRTRLFKASAIIPLADYFEMELNDIVQWRGNYYHLRAINDYNLKDGVCKIELLGPIIRDALNGKIKQPCLFNFSSSVVPAPTAIGGDVYEIYSGSYIWKMHEFKQTGSYSFDIVSETIDDIQVMVIGGGGFVGDSGVVSSFVRVGGGGGAGGLKFESNLSLNSGSFTIQVGNGGDGYIAPNSRGKSGESSSMIGPGINIAVAGGGGGGGALFGDGASGASGGGGTNPGRVGGTGILGQGNNGGTGAIGAPAATQGSGGGGGFFASGSNGYLGGVNARGGGRGGHGVFMQFTQHMTIDGYCGGGNGIEFQIPFGYESIGSGNGTQNDMMDMNRIGGGVGVRGADAGGTVGVVRIMYPIQEFNSNETETYRFTCNSISGSTFDCKIQYMNSDGNLISGEFLSKNTSVDKVVIKNSPARITAIMPLALMYTQPIFQRGLSLAPSGGTITVL